MPDGAAIVTQESARHLEVAHTLGEHAARIGGLESRVERELSDIRSSLQRLEALRAAPPAAPQPDPNIMLLAQSVNRLADQPKPPHLSDVQQLIALVQNNGSGAKRDPSQIALWVSILFNGGLAFWLLRQAIFGG